MKTATFYHAGCPVCVEAENLLVASIDRSRFQVEIVDLGSAKHRIPEAESHGVRSVPALVLEGAPLHINHGANLSDLL
jgi:glutaredoxin